ncbi:MAG: hypothetical protein K6G62_06525 [Eubacterium sp.]|nr:hypothetical protein [Eubacterium sp.]
MKKRNYTRRQLAIIVALSAAMLLAAILLNKFLPAGDSEPQQTVSPAAVVSATASPAPTETPDPTLQIATFLQGPKSWEARREWSGKWGKQIKDGGSFGGFGCGLCCMANIYTSFSDYKASPLDMYDYAKEVSEYEGGGAIDWGYMKGTLQAAGFTCDVFRKPKTYKKFQELIKNSMTSIVVVSSAESQVYWQNTPGHYVTLFLYDQEKDQIFLGDSGDPNHNRHWVSLKKIYKSLKTANRWQILLVTAYDEEMDNFKNESFGGTMVLPDYAK